MILSYADFQSVLTEGRYDPGILKCIFLAGGPGSGKSYVAEKLFDIPTNIFTSLSPYGLKLVNSDAIFEKLLQAAGISPDFTSLSSEDQDRVTGDSPTSFRSHAKKLTYGTKEKPGGFFHQYLKGKLGMIVDGTGDSFQKIVRQKQQAEDAGYDTYLIFVETTLEVAQARNAKRDRKVDPRVVETIWRDVQRNLDVFLDLFGQNFLVVNNNPGGTDADLMALFHKLMAQVLRRPIDNPLGRHWLDITK